VGTARESRADAELAYLASEMFAAGPSKGAECACVLRDAKARCVEYMWSVDAQTLRRLFTSRAVAQAVREAERNWARGGLRTRLVDSVGKVLLPPSTYTVFPRDHRARTHATHWGLAARGLSQRPLECHTPTLVRQILPRASGFGAGAAPTTPPQVSSSRSGLAECCPPCDMWRTMRNFAMQWRGKRCLDVTRRL